MHGASQILLSQSLFTQQLTQQSQKGAYQPAQTPPVQPSPSTWCNNSSKHFKKLERQNETKQSHLTSFFNVRKRFQSSQNLKKSLSSPHIQRSQVHSSPCRRLASSGDSSQHKSFTAPDGSLVHLRSVTELPEEYHGIFSFSHFNLVQSTIIDTALYSDEPVVLCAPTGSGKTVMFDMALIRLLIAAKQSGESMSNVKAIYMAPIKALCSERFADWKERFGLLGLKCQELTGDTEVEDFRDLTDSNLILTTPEKWDSMTRRWRDNKTFVRKVRLFMIDEVHMLNDQSRGATVEAVISRMKTVRADLHGGARTSLRFVSVSATMSNIEDVAEWLGTGSKPAVHFKMDDRYRPVKLTRIVQGYPCGNGYSDFKFDYSLNYKLPSVIQSYSNNRPTLVFVSTRKGTVQSASLLQKNMQLPLTSDVRARLKAASTSLRDSSLRECIQNGIGFHNAGLDHRDRKTVEELFISGDLRVLFSTSTLAMGVNLPAHLVIIKSTQHYTSSGYEEYSETEMLQMIGRAGRPQFDTAATAVILTKSQNKQKYDRLVDGKQMLESSLHKNLIEHLNAEIVLSTITDVQIALDWLKSTFLYVRIFKHPSYYGLNTKQQSQSQQCIEAHLKQICVKQLTSLNNTRLISMDGQKNTISSTESGRLMARYIISYDTMSKMDQLSGSETQMDLITFLSECKEFSEIQLRVTEKKPLNELNKSKNKVCIRYPMKGKIKTAAMKVNCLIQTQLGCLPLQEFSLQQDITRLFRIASRITKCLVELYMESTNASALENALNLHKCISAHMWENSGFVTKQLFGIGQKAATTFVNAGILSFSDLEKLHPRDIELMQNRHPPFGSTLHDAALHLPKYELAVDQNLSNLAPTDCEISIALRLANRMELINKCTAKKHCTVLLVYDSDDKVLYRSRIFDGTLIKKDIWSTNIRLKRAVKNDELSIQLLSQSWVGLDIRSTFTPRYNGTSFLDWRRKQAEQLSVISCAGKGKGVGTDCQTSAVGSSTCGHKCLNKLKCAHACCKPKKTISKYISTLINKSGPAANCSNERTSRNQSVNMLSPCAPLHSHSQSMNSTAETQSYYGNFTVGSLSSFSTDDETTADAQLPGEEKEWEDHDTLTGSPPLSLQGYTQYDWKHPDGLPSQKYDKMSCAFTQSQKDTAVSDPYLTQCKTPTSAAHNNKSSEPCERQSHTSEERFGESNAGIDHIKGRHPYYSMLNTTSSKPPSYTSTIQKSSYDKVQPMIPQQQSIQAVKTCDSDGFDSWSEEEIPLPSSPALRRQSQPGPNRKQQTPVEDSDNSMTEQEQGISYSPLESEMSDGTSDCHRLDQSEFHVKSVTKGASDDEHDDQMLANLHETEEQDYTAQMHDMSEEQVSHSIALPKHKSIFSFKTVKAKPASYGQSHKSMECDPRNSFRSGGALLTISKALDCGEVVDQFSGFAGMDNCNSFESDDKIAKPQDVFKRSLPKSDEETYHDCKRVKPASYHCTAANNIATSDVLPQAAGSNSQARYGVSKDADTSHPTSVLHDDGIATGKNFHGHTPQRTVEHLRTDQLQLAEYSPPMSLNTTDPNVNDTQYGAQSKQEDLIFNPSYLQGISNKINITNAFSTDSLNQERNRNKFYSQASRIESSRKLNSDISTASQLLSRMSETLPSIPGTAKKPLVPLYLNQQKRWQGSPGQFGRKLLIKPDNPTAFVRPLARDQILPASSHVVPKVAERKPTETVSLFPMLDILISTMKK